MQRKTKVIIAAASAAGLTAIALGGFAVAHSRHEGMGYGMGYGMMDGQGRGHGKMGMAEDFAERYDTNKDGKISQEEIKANQTQWLAEADTNKDGKLSLEEFKPLWLRAQSQHLERAFQTLDADSDASISSAEYGQPLERMLAHLDKDEDGALSMQEMQRHGKKGGWGKRMHGNGNGGPETQAE